MSTAPRIDELRQKFEENPRRYFAPLANELRKAGDLAQAIALCREHLPKQPGHMSGHIVFGQALFESGELGEARGVFERALALDPENLIALRHLGDVARLQGEAGAARRWYERVLEADPRNDDIAAQLSSLAAATPAVPAVVVAAPTPVGTGVLSPRSDGRAGAEPESSVPKSRVMEVMPPVAAPRPDDQPAHLSEAEPPQMAGPRPSLSPLQVAHPSLIPEEERTFADLDAKEASASAGAHSALAEEQALIDPFFGRMTSGTPAPMIAVAEAEAEAAFEEGFVAEEWPDTTLLSLRTTPPPASPAVLPELPAGTADAFGREPEEALPPEALRVEDEASFPVAEAMGAADDAIPRYDLGSPVAEPEGEPVPAPWPPTDVQSHNFFGIQVGSSVYEFEDEDVPEAFGAEPVGGSALEAVPLNVTAELPWLMSTDVAMAHTPDADDAGPGTEPAPEAPTASIEEPEPPEDGPIPVADQSDATFVTETMGELLVAQGFLDRAVVVFEELARRRPADPGPPARLAELRAEQARRVEEDARAAAGVAVPPPAPIDAGPMVFEEPTRSAGTWFASLAARRVARRTPVSVPAVPSVPPDAPIGIAGAPVSAAPLTSPSVGMMPGAESLATLFGGEPGVADESAAHQLAQAFSGAPVAGIGDALFSSGAMAAVQEPTPVVPIAAQTVRPPAGNDLSFDRFFPDPSAAAAEAPPIRATSLRDSITPSASPAVESRAADDLAQFSAWLKGLGES